jgi:hypothetical protein
MDLEYHKQKSREHYQKYKQKYNERNQLQKQKTRDIIEEAKSSGCIKCGEKEQSCLDFHHLGEKDKTVSSMLGMNEERVRAEISKCVILCANCHRKLHAGIIGL